MSAFWLFKSFVTRGHVFDQNPDFLLRCPGITSHGRNVGFLAPWAFRKRFVINQILDESLNYQGTPAAILGMTKPAKNGAKLT